MGGGGPPELFKIIRYKAGAADSRGNQTFAPSSVFVHVSEADRMKIAAILGITDPAEQKQLLAGSVYIHPPTPGAGAPGPAGSGGPKAGGP